jgi:hypothetical protein
MTDRKQVNDFRTVMGEYDSHDISVFIEHLRNLQSEGWERIELRRAEVYEGDIFYVQVTKTRPETDSEYNARIDKENEWKESRRMAYEELKKEFG